MSDQLQAPRGTFDILPEQAPLRLAVEKSARSVLESAGYERIETPTFEPTELFTRSVGEATDIVQKEMYSFTDKSGDRITLRPEATPSMVRAYVEHNLEHAMASAKLFALGPMFRYERPQKGRYRQFHQFDVEAFGIEDPAVDAEVIDLAWSLVANLGIEQAELVINSVGCAACRPKFQDALLAALGDDLPTLCGDCQRRATTNPLRIYDCKVPADQPIIDALPHSEDYLCEPCKTHFTAVKGYLDAAGIAWRQSHRLVRGLDYYTRTTFEILGQSLGAQNALLGGGRYDGLVKTLGGADRTGIGFAAGLERLVLALPASAPITGAPRAFIVAIGDEGRTAAWPLLRALRQAGLPAQMEFDARSVRAQMKRADRVAARVTLIVGGDELARGEITLRDMATGDQHAVAREAIVETVRTYL